MGTPDYAFEEIFPFRPGMQRLRATGVLLQGDLDGLKEAIRNKRFMAPWEKLVMVFDLAGVEGVMQDAPD